MASSTCSAGCSCLVLAASLLAFAVLSTDAQSTSSTAANNSGSNARPKCPVQGVNYCVCADHSCGGCPECAGCDDSQCVGVGPLKEITAARPKLSRAKAVAAAGAGNGRKLRKALSLPSLGAAARSRRSLLQAGTGALVCDGTVRQLDMPAGPYATRVPWNPPFNNQAGFTCERLFANGGCNPSNPRRFNASIAADMCCGNEHNTTCGAYYFSPVTSGSGGSRSIVSPGNPIVYQLTAAEAFLTYVEFTAIDVGTAGAKLAGGYDDDVIPMVENVHSWTTNGPFQLDIGNGTIITTYGPCSNCELGKGIQNMSVTSLPGTGFTRIELSQAFVDIACSDNGASNLNNDGMLWSGMKYSCVTPTCGDVNLQAEGQQPFDCSATEGPLSYVYNPAAAGNTTLTFGSCCLPITCGDTLPLTPEKNTYNCAEIVGPGYQLKASSLALAANNANCCEFVPTCGLPAPGSSGTFNSCNPGFVYDPTQANNTQLGNTCCKYMPTCGKPTADATVPFVGCSPGYVYDTTKATSTDVNNNGCCKYVPTCAKPTENATAPFASCSSGFVYDADKANSTTLTSAGCCKYVPTCAKPTQNATAPFASCSSGFVYDADKANSTTLTSAGCCKYVPTCAKPAASGAATYQCTPPLVYSSDLGNNTSPSDASCCAGTCGDTRPDVNGSQPIDCGPGFDRAPGSDLLPANKSTCCVAQAPRIPTCQDTDTTEPGQQPYTCPSYAVPNPSPQPGLPSDANCCLNRTCANTDPAGNSSTPVPQTCPPNYIINVNMSDVSPPNASVCCMPRISCIDTNPNRDGCQPFFCDPALGYIVNQNASYLPNPSNNVCCLRRTCADTDPLTPGPQRIWCPRTTVYDTSMDSFGPPDRSVCCRQVATCGDADVATNGSQPFVCVAAEGWMPRPGSSNSTSPSNETCCLRQTCADIDPTTAALDAQPCPAGSVPDSSKASFSPPSAEQCCKRVVVPSCNDTQPEVEGCQPYVCDPAKGLVFRTNATNPNPSDSVCCLQMTCLDTDPNTPGNQIFQCGPNQQYDWRRNTTVGPTRAKCCQPLPTCADIDPFTARAQIYYCDPGKGLQFNPNAGTFRNPSDEVCCLVLARPTCADTDPNTPGNTAYQCPAGSVLNAVNVASTNVSVASCCSPTCSNANLASPGAAFSCPAGSAPNAANAGSTTVTAASCCSPTCANTNLASPGAAFACPSGSAVNTANAGSTNVTASSCCLPTCANTNLASSSPSPFTCPTGAITNTANASSTSVTAASCCSPTCANWNLATPGPSPWPCSPGSSPALGSSTRPPSESNCCIAQIPIPSPRPPSPSPSPSPRPSPSPAPGSPTCAGWVCPPGTLPNPGGRTTRACHQDCCLPTCTDTDVNTSGNQTYTCPSGWVPKPGSELATPVGKYTCCVQGAASPSPSPPPSPSPSPSPRPSPSPAPGSPTCAGWVCPPGTLFNPNGRTTRACHQDCCLPTCTDTDVNASGNQTYTCPSGWVPKPGSELATPVSRDTCCMQGSPTPPASPPPGPIPTPSCTANQCPSPATVNALLPQGFQITNGLLGTVTVTYTNNAFLKCDCTQGLSWLTIATCSSTSSSWVNCQKINDVKLGDSVTLRNVACGAVIDVVIHDGRCKSVQGGSSSPASQAPRRVSLSGCRAGTTLPSGCRSSDSDGACGGVYSYRVVCSGGRNLLRKLHFY